ncbi:hypothetical protein BH24ACT5_BH24ACT5_25110 [soil metagenome]
MSGPGARHVDVAGRGTADSYCIHRADTAAGSPSGGAWLFRYPNLATNVYADGMNFERIIPDGPTLTTVVYDYITAAGYESDIDRMVEMSNVVLDEAICEAVPNSTQVYVRRAGAD